jgi:hypothetical protein
VETQPSTQPPEASSGTKALARSDAWTPAKARAVRNGALRFLVFATTYVVAVTISVLAHPQTVNYVDVSLFVVVCLAIPLFPIMLAFRVVELLPEIQSELQSLLLLLLMPFAYAPYLVLTIRGIRKQKQFRVAYILFLLLLIVNFAACTYQAEPRINFF